MDDNKKLSGFYRELFCLFPTNLPAGRQGQKGHKALLVYYVFLLALRDYFLKEFTYCFLNNNISHPGHHTYYHPACGLHPQRMLVSFHDPAFCCCY
jgi:hypothetical protein